MTTSGLLQYAKLTPPLSWQVNQPVLVLGHFVNKTTRAMQIHYPALDLYATT